MLANSHLLSSNPKPRTWWFVSLSNPLEAIFLNLTIPDWVRGLKFELNHCREVSLNPDPERPLVPYGVYYSRPLRTGNNVVRLALFSKVGSDKGIFFLLLVAWERPEIRIRNPQSNRVWFSDRSLCRRLFATKWSRVCKAAQISAWSILLLFHDLPHWPLWRRPRTTLFFFARVPRYTTKST